SAHASELDFSRGAFTDHGIGPLAVAGSVPDSQAFLTGRDQLVLHVGVEVRYEEVVLDMIRLASDLHRPRIRFRISGNVEDEQARARTIPVWTFRTLSVPRRHDQLHLLVAVDVGPLDP